MHRPWSLKPERLQKLKDAELVGQRSSLQGPYRIDSRTIAVNRGWTQTLLDEQGNQQPLSQWQSLYFLGNTPALHLVPIVLSLSSGFLNVCIYPVLQRLATEML